jgi:hypothetical protein
MEDVSNVMCIILDFKNNINNAPLSRFAIARAFYSCCNNNHLFIHLLLNIITVSRAGNDVANKKNQRIKKTHKDRVIVIEKVSDTCEINGEIERNNESEWIGKRNESSAFL